MSDFKGRETKTKERGKNVRNGKSRYFGDQNQDPITTHGIVNILVINMVKCKPKNIANPEFYVLNR